MAYRCSTIYAPSTTKLDGFLRDEVFPRIDEQLDVRRVLVDKWSDPGPTVDQLINEIHEQLEIEKTVVAQKPMWRLEEVLRRAERRSDRPVMIVL